MGARIEISYFQVQQLLAYVAPLVGARIEMLSNAGFSRAEILSLPSWERGLKLFLVRLTVIVLLSRSPRGSAD